MTSTLVQTPPAGKRRRSTATNPGDWPRDLIEAYKRYPGPYTIETVSALLEEESLELYNGWLVWPEMTNFIERRAAANIQAMFDISARERNWGQALPDQVECLLADGSVVKPDVILISWALAKTGLTSIGPDARKILQGGPELVVELRSPSNRRTQEGRKRGLYFANQVQIVWDVDERRQQIWVYTAAAPTAPTRFGVNDEIDCPLLPGWRRRVADIFAEEVSAKTIVGEVATQWRAEGLAEGLAEGEAKGRAEGLAEGEAKGRAEGEATGEARGRAEGEALAAAAAAQVRALEAELCRLRGDAPSA